MIQRSLQMVLLCSLSAPVAGENAQANEPPTRDEAAQALRRAAAFFRRHCAKHGGYVWRYSRDLTLSEGEGETGLDTAWVQPPGTPAIGLAYLDAYDATGDSFYLDAAVDTAHALVRGQLQSGGWHYRIEFDPVERRRWGYRDNESFRPSRRKKNKTNVTTLDDDTTQAAVRFLSRVDQTVEMKDKSIHDAVVFALNAIIAAQAPNGGWRQNWDDHPTALAEEQLPDVRASYPDDWSRKWLNDWPGRYYTNDNVAGRMIETMLHAWGIYRDSRYFDSARKTGEFLIAAQLPDPQPAWAQQYDRRMQPCWDRKFEPPAVSGGESQQIIAALLQLYEATGERRFVAPVPKAIAYLKSSRLADGRLARFYELRTNRPLYFTRDYELTYSSDDVPTHYSFIVPSRLDRLVAEYVLLTSVAPKADEPDLAKQTTDHHLSDRLADEVAAVIDALDERGAWIDRRSMKGFAKASPEGVIESATFIRNTALLCRYLRAAQP